MKLFTLLLVAGCIIGVSLMAHAASRCGYGGSGYGKHHGYNHGKYLQGRYYGGYKNHCGYGRKDYGSGYELLGGLIIGGVIGHLITRDHYYHRRGPAYHDTYYRDHVYPSSRNYYRSPVYFQYPVSCNLGPRCVQGSRKERMLQDLNGNCFLITTTESGEETRRSISAAACY